MEQDEGSIPASNSASTPAYNGTFKTSTASSDSVLRNRSRIQRKTGRKNIKSACKVCKASKRKCNGPPSPCDYCESINAPCVFDETADLRRVDAQERALEKIVQDFQKVRLIVEALRSVDLEDVRDKVVELLRAGDDMNIDKVIRYLEDEVRVNFDSISCY